MFRARLGVYICTTCNGDLWELGERGPIYFLLSGSSVWTELLGLPIMAYTHVCIGRVTSFIQLHQCNLKFYLSSKWGGL